MATSDDSDDQWMLVLLDKPEAKTSITGGAPNTQGTKTSSEASSSHTMAGESTKRLLGLLQYTLQFIVFGSLYPNTSTCPDTPKLGKGAKVASSYWYDANFQKKLEILDQDGTIEMRVMKTARRWLPILPSSQEL
jgi:hypothetical protein